MPAKGVDMSFFRNYEKVSPKVCYKLINREKNRALLERIPHIDFLDLSICFFYAYEDNVLGKGSITIYNSHMEMWNCTTEMLFQLAKKNTQRLFPWKLYSMWELVGSRELEEEETVLPGEIPMRVLTNRQKAQGAACMIYPGILERLALEAEENLYIIPSSIHEVILMPESQMDSPELMQDIIREVNGAHIEPEEILSDHLYFYDRLKNRVEIV
jgi:hypothetical protein